VTRKCPECDVDVMAAQVAMHFSAVGSGSGEWPELPVIAGICPKCGRMELHVLAPAQLKEYLDSQRSEGRAREAGFGQ
jgi:hypothetical protein